MEVVQETCNQICFNVPIECIQCGLLLFYIVGFVLMSRFIAKKLLMECCYTDIINCYALSVFSGLFWPVTLFLVLTFLGCSKKGK